MKDERRDKMKEWARGLKVETYALYLAYRDPRVPWYARLWAMGVVAYFFSPIDLIPDPIPILGQLDDLILVPLGIYIALKLIPADVLAECRAQAKETMSIERPANWVAAVIIGTVWLAILALLVGVGLRVMR
jgi:uncharacterized membrane protein YkvA (DUF1232 family)